MKNSVKLVFIFLVSLMLTTCEEGINLFTIQDDINLGLKLKEEITSDTTNFKILPRTSYATSYAFVDGIKTEILNGGQLKYANEFAWELFIVHNDSIQNAFCTPGGYIYIYTGLMKYLNAKDQLAGVMAHEMAHADRRHSTKQMTENYGIQLLLDIILGQNQGALTQIAQGLLSLSFSRADEKDADEHSVKYLCPTVYQADGASDFFELIVTNGGSQPIPEFLSTHPDPDNRITNIRDKKTELGCTGNGTFDPEYAAFLITLP